MKDTTAALLLDRMREIEEVNKQLAEHNSDLSTAISQIWHRIASLDNDFVTKDCWGASPQELLDRQLNQIDNHFNNHDKYIDNLSSRLNRNWLIRWLTGYGVQE